MSLQKFKNDCYCFGGRRGPATTKIHVDVTNKCSKVLIRYCSINICNRKKDYDRF